VPNEVNNYAFVNGNELLADLHLNIIIIHAKLNRATHTATRPVTTTTII